MPTKAHWPARGANSKKRPDFDANAGGQEHDLGIFPQPGGKRLHVWAIEEEL